ncbi:MAG: Ppx/GppA phosphatase family protein [Alphaproteobacteria bacterium]
MDPVYAAIDLGTNNCRLLVARISEGGFRVIDSFSRIVRLGEGLAATDRLGQDAIARTVEALQICAAKIDINAAHQTRAIATEACRRASNCDDFLGMVQDRTGIEFDVISPEHEAQLTLDGCAQLIDDDAGHTIVFDIGGGSTELMWVEKTADGRIHVIGMRSFPLGVVTLTEEFGGDTVARPIYEDIVARVDKDLGPFDEEFGISRHLRNGQSLQMLGTSGTVTTLGGLYLNLDRYDRSQVDGLDMRTEAVTAISDRLASMTCAERAANGCIGSERADLVVMGCAIMEAISRRWPVPTIRAADRGIREGLLYGMMRDNGDLGTAS